MARKRNNKLQPMATMFGDLLPPDYASKRAEIDQLQMFFNTQQSDAVFQMVTVLNVTDDYLHVSLPNATLSAYLRLHTEQIRQMLKDYFQLDVALKISTQPEAAHAETSRSQSDFGADISPATSEKMQKMAQDIDDETLRKAMQSLSKTLLAHKKGG